MTDTIVVRFAVPENLDSSGLPFKRRTDIHETGEIKEHSVASSVLSPFGFTCGRASHMIKPCFYLKNGVSFLSAYEISVSLPAAVCGLNALLQNRVYKASMLALYFLKYWLVENGVPFSSAKKFSLIKSEIKEVHLTYLIERGSKEEANQGVVDIKNRANILFFGDVIKSSKSKSVVEYRESFKDSFYVKISKSSEFDIAAYVKSFVVPKSFCGLKKEIAEQIFDISKNYVRFEVKLKPYWFSETIKIESNRKSRKRESNEWTSPYAWKGEAGKSICEKVFNQACKLLRLDEKFNERNHRPKFLKTLSEEHRKILEAHYAGTNFNDLPFKSICSRQRSKVKKIIQKKCNVDLHIAWNEQKKLPNLSWLKYPGIFKINSVPKHLRDYVFSRETIDNKINEIREKTYALSRRVKSCTL